MNEAVWENDALDTIPITLDAVMNEAVCAKEALNTVIDDVWEVNTYGANIDAVALVNI